MSETLANVFRRRHDAVPATPNASLYERLGGESTVNRAVDIFYRKVIADPRVNYFFFGVNLSEQAAKQKSFLTMAFGGPHAYSGRDLRVSHARLVGMGLRDQHFDIVLDHLRQTLAELQVAEALTGEVMAICESTRDDILNRAPCEPAAPGNAPATRPSASPVSAPITSSVPAANAGAAAVPPASGPRPATLAGILSPVRHRLTPTSTLQEAAEWLSRPDVAALPVVDADGRLIGLVTAADLVRHLKQTS